MPKILTPARSQGKRQLQRRLSAELDDDSHGLFARDDIEHIFFGQRLEVQSVGRVIVGADRFGIAIDHDRFDAFFAQGKRGMDAAIVEFDALPDAVGSSAQDHHFPPIGGTRFARPFIGGIQIWRFRLELGRARIHPFVGQLRPLVLFRRELFAMLQSA